MKIRELGPGWQEGMLRATQGWAVLDLASEECQLFEDSLGLDSMGLEMRQLHLTLDSVLVELPSGVLGFFKPWSGAPAGPCGAK